jgi:hypothetical protein
MRYVQGGTNGHLLVGKRVPILPRGEGQICFGDTRPVADGKRQKESLACGFIGWRARGAAIIGPIYFANDALNLAAITKTFLVAPPPPAPPPPPAVETVVQALPVHAITPATLVAPKVVPKNIEAAKDQPPAEAPDALAGVPGGVPGGELGGTLGGVGTAAPALLRSLLL